MPSCCSVPLADSASPRRAGPHQQAGEIFALARQAEQDIQALTEEDGGRLRFTCPVSTGDRMVNDLLARFAELCPGVQVELNFTNAMIDMSQGSTTSPCAP